MARKKSKALKQDSRGYSTSALVSKVITTITPDDNSPLELPSSEISKQTNDDSPLAPPKAETIDKVVSKRFFKKIENLYDRLIQCKFSEDQIDQVVEGLGNNSSALRTSDVYTLESALDWLCSHVPTENLPPLFTDQDVREAVPRAITSIEVIRPIPLAPQHLDNGVRFDGSSSQSLLVQSSVGSKPNISNSGEKSWILDQYQYEQEGDDELAGKVDTVCDEVMRQDEVLLPSELRLTKLEAEIKALRLDANDEATNYTRSKHEIKEMKKQLSNQETQAKKLRSQIAKHKEKHIKEEGTNAKHDKGKGVDQKDVDGTPDEEDEISGALGMFDELSVVVEKATTTDDNSEIECDPLQFRGAQPSIQKGWTGTTPKDQLEEWCRRHKIHRPTFSKLPHTRNGCKLKIKINPELCLEEMGPFYDLADAHQYLATQALFQMSPELPMYRIFPPVFRDLWKSWLDQADKLKTIEKDENKNAKDERIQKLIDLIPKHLRIGDAKDFVGSKELPTSLTAIVRESNEDAPEGPANVMEAQTSKSQSQSRQKLMDEFSRRRETSAYKEMEETRQKLPIYSYRDQLLQCIKDNVVTVLCAETGAGKTTQAPQFMLEEALNSEMGDDVNILCTQPRRISAISVADRVADEMCVKLGDLVGYQIRGEAAKNQRTKLLFCTTGVVLRRLQDDPSLSGVTIVVVDEVHERSWQIDFLLIALRRLLQTSRPDLKVVLMSATLDSELFCSFFGGAPLISVPGRTFPVAHYFLEDLLDATGHAIEEDSIFALKNLRKSRSTEALWISNQGGEKRREVVELESQTDSSHVSGNYAGFTMMTQRSMDRVDEKILNYDLIEDTLLLLCSVENRCLLTPSGINPVDGAVLVFLPGMSEIRAMMSRLTGSRFFGDTRKFEIVPLHSSLSPRDQKYAFAIPRYGCRKIILATNIAETSVTIPDVVTVIDCGLVREVRQDKRYATSKLVLDWCSKASIRQRAGRAGRVQEGICCRLFSSRTAKMHMKDQTTPELQRIPLEEVCLNILAGNLSNSCSEFLMQAPQPPPLDSVSLAIRLLHDVGVVHLVDNHETLTVLGQHVSKIPVDVRLAKMLIFGALFKCLDPILTIVGSLSTKSPFAQGVHETGQDKAAHKKFQHESSDFLSLVQLWDLYANEVKISKDQGRGFCRRNFINWTVMMEIRDLRRQNLELLCQIGFVGGTLKVDEVSKSLYNKNGCNEGLVHAVVCAGLYPNIAQAVKEHVDDPPSLWHKKERLHFHSSSVNFKKKKLLSHWIVFHEKFATARTTISATSPIHPLTLVLFGGDVVVKHLDRKVIVDEWIHLDFAAQAGIKFRKLRRQLDELLPALIENAESSDIDDMVDCIVQIISK